MAEITDTRERLIAAATELFAERGFHGTKARDIAVRGGVNLAASNYHYGSKRDLYVEVLRRQFAEIQGEIERRRVTLPKGKKSKLSRRQLEDLLRARSKVMMEIFLGPPPSPHGMLMQRELTDPSDALPFIVDEFVKPTMEDTRAILGEIDPGLSDEELMLCTFSVVGQSMFYRFAMPALLRFLDLEEYPKGFAAKVARHVADFSLGGLDQIGRRRRRAR